MSKKLRHLIFGKPRDVSDPGIYHQISLVAFLAWVGLGADGLSSSCYGPEESFKILGTHHYLAVAIAAAIVLTVFIIAYAYSRVIEHFPFGGGGYTVATRLLGPHYGLVSGSALLHDYFLTITISIAAGADAFFSFLPPEYAGFKLPSEYLVIMGMTALNLRGVKESILPLVPIFLLFVATHLALILGTVGTHVGDLPAVARDVHTGFQSGLSTLGWLGMAALFLRAYAMGAGTYTGIEAVSNGLQIMREPKVQTGKRTMVLMATSLAFTAGGIILAYLLLHVEPVAGMTMNAVLTHKFIEALGWASSPWGRTFIVLTMASEAALLVIAAQAGFVDGPRIMANMATDSWLPHRFAALSDRLTVQDGVLLMSAASLFLLWHTQGDVGILVVMYSINVFLTFCLTEASMIKFWLTSREEHPDWWRKITVHLAGFAICLSMLILNIVMKFTEGGWETVVITSGIITLCLLIKRHYRSIGASFSRLDEILTRIPASESRKAPALDHKAPTAVLLVGRYGGLGVHSILSIQKLFPDYFKNFVFVSVGVIDSATFKGVQAVEDIRRETRTSLERYAALAHGWGLASEVRMTVATEVVEPAEELCVAIQKDFPRSIVFAGKLIFEQEKWYQTFLHNETGFELQRRLQFRGVQTVILPIRVL